MEVPAFPKGNLLNVLAQSVGWKWKMGSAPIGAIVRQPLKNWDNNYINDKAS